LVPLPDRALLERKLRVVRGLFATRALRFIRLSLNNTEGHKESVTRTTIICAVTRTPSAKHHHFSSLAAPLCY